MHSLITPVKDMNTQISRRGTVQEAMAYYMTLLDLDISQLSILHIAGTKGKGSTSAFCERILRDHGVRTGLFTSPHLVDARERIRVNGRPVSASVFETHFWGVYDRLVETEVGVLNNFFFFLFFVLGKFTLQTSSRVF